MSNVNDKGKWAESQARKWLDQRSSADSNFAFHRYPDAKAARGQLSAQPSDYIAAQRLQVGRRAFHIEVKETKQINRLPKSKIRQYGMLMKFWWAGIEPIVLVYRSEVDDWVYLTSKELFFGDSCPPSFVIKDLPSYPTAAAALEVIFL